MSGCSPGASVSGLPPNSSRRAGARLAATLAAGLVAAPVAAAPAAAPPLDAAAVRRFADREMRALLADSWVPGAALAIVQGDQLLHIAGYGLADVASGRPVDPARTLFRVGSVTKLMTTVAALRLTEQGRLDLDADVNRYLRTARNPDVPSWAPVTPRTIMQHRGGYETAVFHLVARSDRATTMAPAAIARELVRLRPPSALPLYDNLGFGVLGLVVADVTRQPVRPALRELVFAPAAMPTAVIGVPDARTDDVATGYAANAARRPVPAAPALLKTLAQGSGDASVTANDMANFMRALIEPGRLLAAPPIVALQRGKIAYHPQLPALGLSVMTASYAGRSAIAKDGDLDGFTSIVVLFPETRVGVFVSFNGGRLPPQLRLSSLAARRDPPATPADPQRLRDRFLEAFAATLLPTEAPIPRARSGPELPPAELVGSYFRTDQTRLLLGRLLMRMSGLSVSLDAKGRLATGGCAPFVRRGPMYYECRAADGRLTKLGFRLTRDGRLLAGRSATSMLPRQRWWHGAAMTVLPLLPLGMLQVAALARRPFERDAVRRRSLAVAGASGAAFLAALLLELEFGASMSQLPGQTMLAWLWRPLFPLATLGLIVGAGVGIAGCRRAGGPIARGMTAIVALGAVALAALSVHWGLATLAF